MKKTGSKFLDSSAWLSYLFAENDEIKEIIDSDGLLYTSVISLFEIRRKFLREKIPVKDQKKALNFIKSVSIVIDLNEVIAERASEISHHKGLHAMDALIYTSALSTESILVTGDSDFEGLKDVLVIGRKDAL